jgi:hypothetical protein
MSRFRGQWVAYWPFWGFALVGIALAAWEGFSYHNKTAGTVVLARVDDCQVDPVKGVDVTCKGEWPAGSRGELLHHGTIDGVDISDMGRTLKVRVHGGTAYAHTRLIAPVVFFFVGLAIAAGFAYGAWRNAGRASAVP